MRTELPNGWELAEIACLAQLINGDRGDSYPTKSSFVSDGVPFINAGHLNDGEITSTEMNYITLGTFQALRSGQVQEDDILFCLRGSLGKVGLVKGIEKGAIASSLVIVRPIAQTHTRFLLYFLRSQLAKKEIEKHNNGSAQPNLASKSLAKFVVPVAPIEEQKRIADKLDTVLTRVDAVNSRLARVAPLLKRFRQSVLAAATSGRLTKDWREANDVAEPWMKVCLGDIADVQGGVTKDSKKQSASDEELPYLRVANVQRGYIDLSEVKTIRVPAHKLDSLLLEAGDILFNEGGDLDKLGRGWIWEGQIERCTYQNHVFRARLHNKANQPKYVSWWGNYQGLRYFIQSGKQTTNLASINKTMLAALPISMPSPAEQTEIVRRVETLFACADRLEARLAQAQTAATRLTPALLAKAFRGELVPQDPNDEPAAELLRRLQTERATGAPASKTGAGRGRGRKAILAADL